MAWCISAFGREEMAQIAIEEWAGSSPIYTRRMQKALGYAPITPGTGDVVTIFKGLQLDIGAPPQFMDFRYTVHDPWHGEFHLDHCGALMDVEPMGEDYVRSMCHDIEDPTFDATAVASNPKAQVRPIHRPPRRPEQVAGEQRPHCAWTVIIDESYPAVQPIAALAEVGATHAATLLLDPIDRVGGGARRLHRAAASPTWTSRRSRTRRWSGSPTRSACRCTCSTCRSWWRCGRAVDSDEQAREIATKQLVGIAGIAAERISRALGTDALRDARTAPAAQPGGVRRGAASSDATLRRHASPAHEDGAWISLCGPDAARPLQAIVRAVDPHLDVEVDGLGHRAGPHPRPPRRGRRPRPTRWR